MNKRMIGLCTFIFCVATTSECSQGRWLRGITGTKMDIRGMVVEVPLGFVVAGRDHSLEGEVRNKLIFKNRTDQKVRMVRLKTGTITEVHVHSAAFPSRSIHTQGLLVPKVRNAIMLVCCIASGDDTIRFAVEMSSFLDLDEWHVYKRMDCFPWNYILLPDKRAHEYLELCVDGQSGEQVWVV